MPQAKPGVDWAAIRKGFEAGTSIRELARQHAPLTHRAIQKRRDKEGWDTKSAATLATYNLPSVATSGDRHKITTHRTPEKAQTILEGLRQGWPKRTAALKAGMHPSTLDEWLLADPDFADLAEQAVEDWHASKLGQIDAAGDRGDWKASAYRLERHHKTRDIYAAKDGQGVNIQVNLSIGRDEPTVTIEGTKG